MNKLESPTFLDTLRLHDIICLQETHCGAAERPTDHILDFAPIPHCRKISSNNRYFGGMLLLVRKSIRKGIKITYDKDPDILGITLNKEFFGLPHDTLVWFVYAPPATSPYTKERDNVLSCLETLMINNDNHERSLILGDLNGKTACNADYLIDEGDNHSPITQVGTYTYDTPSPRNNRDDNAADGQGKMILEICKALNMRILNGRTPGDRWGNLTRFPIDRTEQPSVLDYAVCNSNLLQSIQLFIIFPLNELSDHCCISASIDVGKHIPKHEHTNLTPHKNPPRLKIETEGILRYKQNLVADETFRRMQDRITNARNPSATEVDNFLETINQHILDNARKSFRAKPRNRQKIHKQRKPANWFNQTCLGAKQRYQRAIKGLQKDPFNKQKTQHLLTTRKEYKRACRTAESAFRSKLLTKLMSVGADNPKQFWNLLKDMKNWGKERKDPSDNISPDDWKQYFTKLLNSDSGPLKIEDNNDQVLPEMDRIITLEELKHVSKKAKNGKACGPDEILIELIKHATDNVLTTLTALMNLLYNHTKYPTQWTSNYLKTIFKKGSQNDPDNYRGLAIGSAIGKLYSTILLHRLESFVAENGLLSPFQIAFWKGFRTSDHIFLLKTLVNKIIKQKGGKIFTAFIDFKKAYDTVNRGKLLTRLKQVGVSSKFLRAVTKIYTTTTYTIKTKHFKLDPITSNLGLKQGCPLSPLLFNLYIDDLAQHVSNSPDDISLQGSRISHFLYADDLVLLSSTKEGLQRKLNELATFADSKDLTVSTGKSKIMVFNKAGRKSKDKFLYKNQKLEVVNTFTYLGIEIMTNGSFATAIKTLTDKAKKAMMPLYKTMIQFQMPFHKCKQLFNTFIEPILLYNAENWSTMTDKQIRECREDSNKIYEMASKTLTTTAQLKFYKFMMGVNKSCPNLAIFGDTGELPLQLKAYIIMLKYWDRLRFMDDQTLVKKAYLENIQQNSNWAKTIQLLNVSLGLHTNPRVGNRLINSAKSNLTSDYSTYWRTSISESPRLDFYSNIKDDFKEESYLNLPSFRDRQTIAKLRCSNHCLEIEKGRHKNTQRDHRICKLCTLSCVEDEYHFLFRCPCYDKIRMDNFGTNNIHPDNYQYTFRSLTNPSLAKYIKESLKLREEIIGYYRVSYTSLSGMKIKITKSNKKVAPSKINPLNNLQAIKSKGDNLRITISRKERKKRWKSTLNPDNLKMLIRCINPAPK